MFAVVAAVLGIFAVLGTMAALIGGAVIVAVAVVGGAVYQLLGLLTRLGGEDEAGR